MVLSGNPALRRAALRHPGGALWLAGETGLPVVATHPVQFMHRDDHKAHEARCASPGRNPRRPPPRGCFTEEQYFKSTAEMAELFADLPEALANPVEIAKRCNVTIQLGKNYLPDFPHPGRHDAG